jgi:hypothetical protein
VDPVIAAEQTVKAGAERPSTAAAPPQDAVAGPTDPYGHVDRAGADGIVGWAVDRARPGERVRLVVLHRGQVVATGATGLPREDVVAAGLGPGQPGFRIAPPESLTRLPGAQVTVREAVTGRELAQSPATIAAAGMAPGAWCGGPRPRGGLRWRGPGSRLRLGGA